MKHIITFCLFILAFTLSASNTNQPSQNSPQIGDQFIINKHSGETYTHVKFPRLNILVKRGAIASYNSTVNVVVTVEEISTNKKGEQILTLKRKDGLKFFGYLKSVKANYSNALISGEISKLEN